MSPLVQVKLLRVLQERQFRRLGGTEEVEADIRDHRGDQPDLTKMVAEGRFREDLFYRINVIPMRLPPLRERREDIPLLAEHFVARFAEQMGKPITASRARRWRCCSAYAWPGNIRELENAIERAVALERTPAILPDSLPARFAASQRARSPRRRRRGGAARTRLRPRAHVQDIERDTSPRRCSGPAA